MTIAKVLASTSRLLEVPADDNLEGSAEPALLGYPSFLYGISAS